ncbi:phage terminase large subunit [Mesorhizobium sp. WSM4982]|uniref:phage terminase large subunit n=1 Tax=Mesorhizobium sp. WSM4982 TaxID=3038550 RepID=UPI0024152197|nr:phage terminase large subunit [Mesorhizobium sp. WSM4982]MDG4856439.1 phage terminase large subunit [Mesorhizobium sp. WSM4982]
MADRTFIDAEAALAEHRRAIGMPSSSDFIIKPLAGVVEAIPARLEERAKKDFRVFLTIIWRHLLGVDPSPIQLDMAYWLQHGPSRAITMAFRGFSKSWITGAYALWRLYVDPDEKILVVSGSLLRAAATTNWCLQLIMTLPLLKDLRPKTHNRQSSTMFDVGNCVPAQSASFMALGIGGQLVGFRGTCIIPDDVETQTNSLTETSRVKTREAVKEFESVLTPGGVIKYLGTPHDSDSLYLYLLGLRGANGEPVYQARIWPAYFPNDTETKGYKGWLAPYIGAQIRKHGPGIIGHSTMPNRFTDADLEGRRAAMGNSEFRLQFMLDLTGTLLDKFPLRLKDLVVMDLDQKMGPDSVIWGTSNPIRDLTPMGHDGDFYYGPVEAQQRVMVPYQEVVGMIDGSGRGTDETALSIVGYINGWLFFLHLFASTDGYSPDTLRAIASACVRFNVGLLRLEANFGDGMFTALLQPVLLEAWKTANSKRPPDQHGGTRIEEVQSSNRAQKEKRILSVLEPVTQQHRLVVSRRVIEDDRASLEKIEGEETRHRYAWGYQYTHLTRERDSLAHDDRLESLAGACAYFAPKLGVDPLGMAVRAQEDRYNDELERLLREDDEAVGRAGFIKPDTRVAAALPQSR